CALLRHPHHAGHPRRLEQFPRDGHRRRGRGRPGVDSCNRRRTKDTGPRITAAARGARWWEAKRRRAHPTGRGLRSRIPPRGSRPMTRDPAWRRMTRRGFAWGGAAAVAGLAGWRWVVTRGVEDGLPWPLRRVLEWNEGVARGLSRSSRLSPEFPR